MPGPIHPVAISGPSCDSALRQDCFRPVQCRPSPDRAPEDPETLSREASRCVTDGQSRQRSWRTTSLGRITSTNDQPASTVAARSGGHASGEDAGRARRQEERRVVLAGPAHRLHVEAQLVELGERRPPVGLD